ncbi:MAG TPA: hypothetical protein VJ689_00510 [Gaiellaceae bacterium]|jgi:hypothetical protein|nr:hypothetical protein [Gaiellaceae bacterium]
MTPDDTRAQAALLVVLGVCVGFALGWLLRASTSGGVPPSAHLDLLSRDELYARARAAALPGRSSMRKEELLEALRTELDESSSDDAE